jgi:hypothetical protein
VSFTLQHTLALLVKAQPPALHFAAPCQAAPSRLRRHCRQPRRALGPAGCSPKTRCPPPSLAPNRARRRACSTSRAPPRRHGRPRRSPCLAAGAAPRRPLPRPNQPSESAPWDPRPLPRPCLAGPGRRLAGIWPDRRCPAAQGRHCKEKILSRVHAAKG